MDKPIIQKTIQINAPKEKVWEMFTTPEAVSAWSYEFSQGTKVEGDWSVGGTIVFRDNTGNGLRGKVVENTPFETLRYDYISTIEKGVESDSGEEFEKWRDCYDKYVLSENNGVTTLTLESKNPREYHQMFVNIWDKTVVKIKEYAETMLRLENEGFRHVQIVALPHGEAPEHTHDHHSVHVILNGELIIKDNEGEKTYIPGNRVEFPAGTTHKADSTGNGSMIIGFK